MTEVWFNTELCGTENGEFSQNKWFVFEVAGIWEPLKILGEGDKYTFLENSLSEFRVVQQNRKLKVGTN